MTVSTSDLIDKMLANTAVLTGDPVHSISYRADYLESILKEILIKSPEAVNIINERLAYQNSLIEQCKKQ